MDAYCWPQSVDVGSTVGVGLHISHQGHFEVQVYDACDEDKSIILHLSGESVVQFTPVNASSHGCGWPVTLNIPTQQLKSSLYLVCCKSGMLETLAYFVVRPSISQRSTSKIICVLSTSTWCAYNDWGGGCLYRGLHQVSFQRPIAKGFLWKPADARRKAQPPPGDKEAEYFNDWARENGHSVWSGSSGWWNWERIFCHWAKKHQYEFDVATSEDLHLNQDLLHGYNVIVCVGHDEYWSWNMRDNLDAFRNSGGNVCILSGNTMFWQVRFVCEQSEAAAIGDKNPGTSIAHMICYKYSADQDPVVGTNEENRMTSSWVDRRIGRPEYSSIGLSFSKGGYSRYGLGVAKAAGGFNVYRPDHWLFQGLQLCFGDAIGANAGIVAYEVDGCAVTLVNGLPEATFIDEHDAKSQISPPLTILALAPASLWSQFQQPSRYVDEPGELEAVALAIYGNAWRENVHKHQYNHAIFAVSEPSSSSNTASNASSTNVGGSESETMAGILVNVGVTDWVCGLLDDNEDIRIITKNMMEKLQHRSH